MEGQTNNNIVRKESSYIEEFDEPLSQPGRIFLAQIHGSAQRLLKVKKLSKYIRFCKCCLLPSATPGLVMPYTCLDKREDYGLGIQLYFSSIRFCILISFIGICLSAIPTIVFSRRYANDLEDHCRTYYNDRNNSLSIYPNAIFYPELLTRNEDCIRYLDEDMDDYYNVDLEEEIQADWAIKFSADNTINYYNIFKEHAIEPDDITDVLFDYSLVYFITSITLLIINFIYIQYTNLLIDKEDFETTSPRDFTLLIHNVTRPKDNKNITKINYLNEIMNEISRDYFPLDIYQIIPCYNLTELYQLTKNVFEDRTKIYHAYNFKRQKNLHEEYIKKYGNKINNELNKDTNLNDISKDNNYNIQTSQYMNEDANNSLNQLYNNNNDFILHDNRINYYTKSFCSIKATPLNEIEQRIVENKKKINEIEKDLKENPDNYSSGTYFVVFKYISMREKFYDFFPTNLFSITLMKIKYFFQNIFCGKCTNEKTKRTNYLKTAFGVEHATEAYEIIWQNLGFSLCQKFSYLSASIGISILLIGFSFGIVLALNYAQNEMKDNDNSHKFAKYLLSLIISIVIAIINSLGKIILQKVTERFEAIETRTDFYISLAIKTTIFTFLNINIVPLLSNYLHEDWYENDILLNNIFMIFIVNISLKPLIFYLSPRLLVKLLKRAKARRDLEGIPWKDSTYTQGELNAIFENPDMRLSYKYSYLANCLLASFFYMSIFPLGIILALVGFILCYFLEIFYLGLYKRPEVLNSRLSKFFINNFKFVVAVFCIGNYVFLFKVGKHYDIDWALVNIILFVIIVFIPYHYIKFNLLGITEGEITKGSYDQYELMFPTDYEKQNPLTKKDAMIKYFNRLEQKGLIDNIQSRYFISNIEKESSMDSYYKTSGHVGNLLNYYEFHKQFIKTKKQDKYIKEIKAKKNKINDYEIFINQKAEERRAIKTTKNIDINNKAIIEQYNINNNLNNYPMDSIENEKNIELNKLYEIKGLAEDDPKYRKKINVHMRKALIQSIKDEGLYSDTEEESEGDSNEKGPNQM